MDTESAEATTVSLGCNSGSGGGSDGLAITVTGCFKIEAWRTAMGPGLADVHAPGLAWTWTVTGCEATWISFTAARAASHLGGTVYPAIAALSDTIHITVSPCPR